MSSLMTTSARSTTSCPTSTYSIALPVSSSSFNSSITASPVPDSVKTRPSALDSERTVLFSFSAIKAM
ncbi:hypothetical protein G6F57_023706 [Rhizopus arrhizus]|nr:hypothetical protein G6F57_023706 [Rhizopus arrhizus]